MDKLLNFEGDNFGGICQIWMSTACELTVLKRACGKVDLCGFDNMQEIYFRPKTAELKSKGKYTQQGTKYDNLLKFVVEQYREEVLDFICKHQDQELAFVILDKNGVYRLLYRAILEVDDQTGLIRGDLNKYDFRFASKSKNKPPIIGELDAFTVFSVTLQDCGDVTPPPPPPPDTGLECSEVLTEKDFNEIRRVTDRFVVGYNRTFPLNPNGGVFAFWATPFNVKDAFFIRHNLRIKAASSIDPNGNGGPFFLDLNDSDYPLGLNWIGINSNFTPDRVAEFMVDTGLPAPLPPVLPVGADQVVWWEYTADDYNENEFVEIVVNVPPSNNTSFMIKGLCFEK